MDQNRNEWFAQTYQKMYPIMYRTAYRFTGSTEKAEELVHDAFSLALSRQDTLISHPNPEGWLMKTLTNLAKNDRKRLSSTEISLDTLSLHIPASEDPPDIREWLPPDLPEEDLQILIWQFEDRLSHREIGNRLGISEAGSRSRLIRALRKCRKLLNDRGFHL